MSTIDSGNWLKSSKDSGVKFFLRSEAKLRSWNLSPHLFSQNGIWLPKVGDSSSRMTGMRIKTDSRMLLKLGNKRRVNIDSELDYKFENLGHILGWVQFHKNGNLQICQWYFQKYGIGQVQYNDHKSLVIQFLDGQTHDPMWTLEKNWNQVKTPESLLNQEVKA